MEGSWRGPAREGTPRAPHSLEKSCWMRGKPPPGPPRRMLTTIHVRPTATTRTMMRRGPGAGQTQAGPPQAPGNPRATSHLSGPAFLLLLGSKGQRTGTWGPPAILRTQVGDSISLASGRRKRSPSPKVAHAGSRWRVGKAFLASTAPGRGPLRDPTRTPPLREGGCILPRGTSTSCLWVLGLAVLASS